MSSVWLALWLIPVIALLLTVGRGNVFSEIAVFFSKMAMVTFGGAYAVLAYVAQQAVETYGWLTPGEMLDGLGMAETTPGPLIMVLQFVGFMAAYRDPGSLSPMLAGTLGGLLATWVTFTPCFLWIFLGAPFIEVLRGNRALNGALSAITAAVVGVVLEPSHLVRDPYDLSRNRAGTRVSVCVRGAKTGERGLACVGAFGRRRHCHLPVQGRDDSDAGSMLRRRTGAAPFRSARMSRACTKNFRHAWLRGRGQRACAIKKETAMRTISSVLVCALTAAWAGGASAQEIDWKKVDEALGRIAAVSGDVHRYGFPAPTCR